MWPKSTVLPTANVGHLEASRRGVSPLSGLVRLDPNVDDYEVSQVEPQTRSSSRSRHAAHSIREAGPIKQTHRANHRG
jgi:hypothetical protein